MKATSYSDPERLADVMALIQVLALAHKATLRSEKGLKTDLQRSPRSASSWTQIAKEHPEFFRLSEKESTEDVHTISLIARAVSAKGPDDKRDALPTDVVTKLLEIAVGLHDRERARIDRWKPWLITIGAATILGLFGFLTALIKSCPQVLKCP